MTEALRGYSTYGLDPIGDSIVIVFTKDNPHRLRRTLNQFKNPPVATLLLDDSTRTAVRRKNRELCKSYGIHYHGAAEQTSVLCHVQDTWKTSRIFSLLGKPGWTLGRCRNYALILAAFHGFRNVLMIDDDILFPSWEKVLRDLESLKWHPFVGSTIGGMPDDSVVGHLFRVAGAEHPSYVSGSYLALQLETVSFPFMSSYNEDWIWCALHSKGAEVATRGEVIHLPYDPFENASIKARFQELGELLVEGLLLAEAANFKVRLNSRRLWLAAIDSRKSWIELLDALDVPKRLKGTRAEVIKSIRRVHGKTDETKLSKCISQVLGDGPRFTGQLDTLIRASGMSRKRGLSASSRRAG